MRALIAVCVVTVTCTAFLGAEEPIAAPAPPTLMMASATPCGPAVTLHIRTTQFVPTTIDIGRKMPVSDSTIVNGRVVERVRYLEVLEQQTVMRPTPGAVISVPVDGEHVFVTDLKGKPVLPSRLATMLKKETAVLVSMNGPVDPFFLQTTKPGTLIVYLPAERMSAPLEILPPAKTDPNEPPLAMPK